MTANPLALIAEVTHRCPLHCVYCSNPLKLVAAKHELSTQEWVHVFSDASRMGVLHLHLTGGEPAARTDLPELIAGGRKAGLYTNLITSGIGLSEARLAELVEAGLDHIQLSSQDSREEPARWIAGAKACMGGWGRRLMLISPSGEVLPCHAAGIIPGMEFDNVRQHTLDWIWKESAAFQRFRGDKWMPEPCCSCERRTEDFAGCRCQAFLVAGDATATDPVCSLSPNHHLIEAAQLQAKSEPTQISWSYRTSMG